LSSAREAVRIELKGVKLAESPLLETVARERLKTHQARKVLAGAAEVCKAWISAIAL
jgi:hypothetical protein